MKKVLLLALILGGCSFKNKGLNNQVSEGHKELYTYPEAPSIEKPEEFIRLSVASFNDLEAQIQPLEIKFKDKKNKEEESIKIGGKEVITQYINILRANSKNTLLLDAGDIFSPHTPTKDIIDFYEDLKFDAITFGMSDFNIKLPEEFKNTPDYLKHFAASTKTPLILSNLYDLKTARHIEWPGSRPYVLKTVGDIKVGIIGLIPDDIVGKTTVDNRLGLFVENMLQSTLRQARLLKSLGANIVVVMTHQSLNCGLNIARQQNLPLEKVNFEPRNPEICDLTSVLGEFVNRLPPNLVDVVIGGRSEQKVANYVNDTLVMSGFAKGVSFNLADFYFNKKTKELIPQKTQVFQPVMTCHEFFKETNDCYYKDESVNHAHRVPAKFFDVEITLPKQQVAAKTTQIDYFKAINELGFHLVFHPKKRGVTKLAKLEIKGSELAKLLEEGFNTNHKTSWHPNPYLYHQNVLTLNLAGEKVQPEKSYWIGIDLESFYNTPIFAYYTKNQNFITFAHKSWNDYSYNDAVSTKLSSNLNGTKLPAPDIQE